MNSRWIALFIVAISVALPAQENQELGRMWTFENAPLEYWKAEYGFEAPPGWLDSARLASIRFGNGCSSSFVSPRGLILTNHHCIRDYVAAVSPKKADWVRDGYFARSLAEEVKIPGLTVQQLIKMEDVTEAMNAGVAGDDSDDAVNKKREANQATIIANAKTETPDLTPQVVKLFQGGMFQLYRYRVFNDIRLVAAPNLQTAHFGGDPDNFTYPRYGIDFALARAYIDGKPADTAGHYFEWCTTGTQENELVFVTGNPGRTDRAKTHTQFEMMRDVELPIRLESIDNRIEILQRHATKSADNEKEVRTEVLSLQNSQKAIRGYHGGLLDANLMAQKNAAESAFRAKIEKSNELSAKFGDAWPKLEIVMKEKRAFFPAFTFQTFQGNRLLQLAFHIVRVTDPNTSDTARKTNREQLASLDLTEAPYDLETVADHLTRATRWLPKDDPFLVAALGGKSPADAAAHLWNDTKLRDKAFVNSLLDGGQAAVEASDDPMIKLARVLAPLAIANQQKRLKVDAEENVQTARVGQALFAVYGHKIGPDATFTLRITDGRVKGFPFNGTIAPWRTTFHGLYARCLEFDNTYPFDLPPIWIWRKDRVDMTKSVNFVSTNDITGGNSGSPVINKNLQVIGLAFDGNIESLPNRFVFTDKIARTVSVHADAIIECLLNVYDRPQIVDELLGKGGYN